MEPLCGGLTVTLGLRPRDALLNDVNPHNINFYRWLQRGLDLKLPMANDEEMYYIHRHRLNQLTSQGEADTKETAALFYDLNHTGYNGLCRFNRRGEFNVPFGRHATITYPQDLRAYAAAMARWRFSVGDFEAVPLEPGDFVYADPPYDVEFTQYSPEKFGWEQQVRLATWLAGHAGPVVLSNQATDRITRLYEELGFGLRYEQAPRMISCNGNRSRATEVIATRNL